MSYGFYPEVFKGIEADIDAGLYEQARERLDGLTARHAFSREQGLYAEILLADIDSYTAHFHEALKRQQKLLAVKPMPLRLRAAALMSHAYTVGYSGSIPDAQTLFAKAEALFNRTGYPSLAYQCRIGACDISFYTEYVDRWNPKHNELLLQQLQALKKTLMRDSRLSQKDRISLLSQVHFRKAVLEWLCVSIHRARRSFAFSARHSAGYPIGVWAYFGLAYCTLQSSASEPERYRVIMQLEQVQKKPAWKKLAKKYWPIALLIGETWRLLGQGERTRKFYRTILKNEFEKFTKHVQVETDQAVFMARYFFPVYLYDLKDHISTASSTECRYAIARAELFRARFLTEIYKHHHQNRAAQQGFSPNIRIDEINKILQNRLQNVAVVYCFDFRDHAVLLVGYDLEKHYEKHMIHHKTYRQVKRMLLTTMPDTACIRQLSRIFEPIFKNVYTQHMVVIPHGLFNDVPLHRLCISGEPLLERCMVNYWPSLHMAAIDTANTVGGKGVLFVGTRAVDSACKEIETIIKEARPDCYDVLFDPSNEQLRTALQKGWAVLHIVTHGSPDLNGTVLHFAKKKLDLKDIGDGTVPVPPVVVLNVCYGGLCIHTPTDAFQGMPVLLMQHGARAVIANSRCVPQDVALHFATEFYRCFFGGGSLRNAYRQAILKNGSTTMLPYAPGFIGNSLLEWRH
ncbi:MAG: CHAT domain-containing protein [Desulfobacterota bacterium]|nr:CHAT domain-containing protein [Thermodesulfobacteriota bacterium]